MGLTKSLRPFQFVPANSALLTDASGLQLRCAHRAAKRGR